VQDAEQKKGKKKQHESKKYRQFPVRFELSVSDQLDRYAKLTRIPKTTIARFAIEKFKNKTVLKKHFLSHSAPLNHLSQTAAQAEQHTQTCMYVTTHT
jgi:hypothetical protein